MRHLEALLLVCLLAVFLAGCSKAVTGKNGEGSHDPAPVVQKEAEPPVEAREEASAPEIPAKEEVLAAREKALEGMSQEQIARLNQVVIAANRQLEYGYLYDNIFERLKDPDGLEWNYFDQTGEIQAGWAYSGDLDKEAVCLEENLSEDEFYSRYGTQVVANNRYDADAFVSLLEELRADVQNEDLKADLQYMIEETALAKETHIMEHVNNLYKKLHDLDYFLLRYGPGDFGMYTFDKSTVSKYYGTLSIYAA